MTVGEEDFETLTGSAEGPDTGERTGEQGALSGALLEARVWRWVAWNAKIMSDVGFIGDCGVEPMDFFKTHRTKCLRAWRSYKLMRGACVCPMFSSPNRLSQAGAITWVCPEHGNMVSGHNELWLEPTGSARVPVKGKQPER
jgi:hypothetical protein